MDWNRKDTYLSLGAAVLASALLVVGLFSLMSGIDKTERKKAHPEKQAKEEGQTENARNPASDRIRVVLKTNGFQGIEHKEVRLRAAHGLVLHFGDENKEYGGKEVVQIAPEDAMFQNGSITVEAKQEGEKIEVSSLKRGYGAPSYRGKMELYHSAEGIVVVNELPLEEYLYAVVPSEMPASYELEALKAQAVCARSYAVKQTAEYSYPAYEAHVDDSVSYQVYGNSMEKENTIQAVKETAGQTVWHKGKVATTYYFSTSCGRTTSAEAWGTKPSEANSYLQSVELKGKEGFYEEKLPWYRWKAVVSEKTLGALISKNTGTDLGALKSVEVTKRGPGDVALQIKATGEKGTATVDTENKIRRALGGKGYSIQKNDGKTIKSSELLPSAFFRITKDGETYKIEGGGYGHGIGMSQNGANAMAKEGKNYKEILQTFYQDIEVK